LSGRYLIFSSTNGTLGFPGLGPYCATKYAVEGLIESMLYEVDAFNVKATLVEPGYVRLDEPDSGRAIGPADLNAHSTNTGIDQTRLPRYGHFFVKAPSPTYAGPNAPAGHAKRVVQWLNDRQPTSAVKSAELVWQLGHCSYPPLRLLLGSYAVESIRDRLRSIIEEIEDWKHLSFPVTAEQEEAERLAEDLQAADEQAGELQDERDGLGTGEAKEEGEMQRVLEEKEGQELERSVALEQNQQQQQQPVDGNGATLDKSTQSSP
ncbi:1,2-dihydroxy-3-keto-5-methylthiopentene dioxygenase, partial [Cryomyces antarcticus]